MENRRLLTALTNSVAKLGVAISAETNVESLAIERGRVAGVQTSRGFVNCNTVIVAAGTWSSAIQNAATPPITPIRGQMICFDAKPQLTRHVIYSPRGYLAPRHDGRLLAGSTSENAGFTKQVTAGGVSHILANAHEISPKFQTCNRRYVGRTAPRAPLTVCLCWGLVMKLPGSFMQRDITGMESYSRPSPES